MNFKGNKVVVIEYGRCFDAASGERQVLKTRL
jgi:hypothetical protein